MSNITISLDDDILKKAKKIAIDKDTSFSGLIREYIKGLVDQEERGRLLMIEELDSLFAHSNARIGRKTWTRDELHER
ncbi:MAG: ribbon-helix-helix protein, CopG family [Spirochaetales bacterium]|nr:ribbon-helix-helix protein, CopG family [Spirochaetales bacterium]